MKFIRLLFIITIALTVASCKQKQEQGVPDDALNPDLIQNPATASGNTDLAKAPVMTFEKDSHDFGTITEGEKVTYAFQFKNTGNTELVIRSASGSCGCTVPDYPKDPIAPGKSGVINVSFDSQGRAGMQHKTVSIIANTIPNTTTLNIHGEVVSSEKPN
jgi:hypothetical protein